MSLFTHLCLCNRTRCDDVGGHAPRAIFERNTVRQSVDTSLGDRHVGLERHTTVVNGSTDEDDSTASSKGRRLNYSNRLVKPSKWPRIHSRDFESILCFLPDSFKYGKVALRVLYEPRISISITDLKALAESCSIEARKLPAAPALHD